MQNGLEQERLDYIALHCELLLYPIPPIPHHAMKSRVSQAFVYTGLRSPGEHQKANKE